MPFIYLITLLCCCVFSLSAKEPVVTGVDILFELPEYSNLLKGKRIGLITNHTAVNKNLQTTESVLKQNAAVNGYTVVALFAPEHGLKGFAYASEEIYDQKDADGMAIFSLHGKTRRPTEQMLKNIDLLIYDIQDIGSRSYTYITTLFYAMEEASKRNIPVMVLDRPNPINGRTIDGPMLQDKWRSFVGYINVPYCHGMTVGELARFFNAEYNVGCALNVVPMRGWKRNMTFTDTGLVWIPTSPNVPESTSTWFYPTTGIIGELSMVNIGIGYSLPFKLIGAPWINAESFAEQLNRQKYPGVSFKPFYYRPFNGKFADENCEGVLIVVTDVKKYKPVTTQYLIIGLLKSLYPQQFKKAINDTKSRKEMFCKVNGTDEVYQMMIGDQPIAWPLRSLHQKEREVFAEMRKKYLIEAYGK